MSSVTDWAARALNLALCHNGENLDECLNYLLKSLELIVSLLSETFNRQSSSLCQLKCQYRDYIRQRETLCYDVLKIIREAEKIRQLCIEERREKIDAEIGSRLRAEVQYFNLRDVHSFPETRAGNLERMHYDSLYTMILKS